jgi:hypothetical protein
MANSAEAIKRHWHALCLLPPMYYVVAFSQQDMTPINLFFTQKTSFCDFSEVYASF